MEVERRLVLSSIDADRTVECHLLLSHCANRAGTQAWFLCAPLFLLRFTPGSLLGPGLYGLCSYGAGLLLGPKLGSWADVDDRLRVVRVGVFLQSLAVFGNVTLILTTSLVEVGQTSLICVSLACCFGALEQLSSTLTDVPIKRDWVPVLFMHDRLLMWEVNMRMSQINLATAVLAPFFASFLLQLPALFGKDSSNVSGFVLVGLFKALSCSPQYLLLRSVYDSRKENLARKGSEKATSKKNKFETEAWRIWITHPVGVPILSLSYALLYLTVLSPHGALFTAFLSEAGIPTTHLCVFRGAGAFAGLFGVSVQPVLQRVLSERSASMLAVGTLAAFMIGAAVAFGRFNTLPDQTGRAYLYFFGVCVVLGRPGLYGFELGVLSQLQLLADEKSRAAVGAVDEALMSGFTLATFAAGTIFNKPEQFGGLVLASSTCVALGCLTYLAWCLLYQEHRHRHPRPHSQELTTCSEIAEERRHGHGHGQDHHSHTTQQQRSIDEEGWHSHLVFTPFFARSRT